MSYELTNESEDLLRFDGPDKELILEPGGKAKVKRLTPLMERLNAQHILKISKKTVTKKRSKDTDGELPARRRDDNG